MKDFLKIFLKKIFRICCETKIIRIFAVEKMAP